MVLFRISNNISKMKGSDKLQIYNKIKEICKQKGITPSSVEKQAGLANGLITKWNDFNPTVRNLKAVADVLEVSIDELINEKI